MNKILNRVLLLLIAVCCISIVSCGGEEPFTDDSSNSQDENNNSPTKIVPILDWGASVTDVKSEQSNKLSLVVSTDNLLRYTDKKQEITIDYSFDGNKLIGTCLTQAKVSNINNVITSWLKGYKELAKSENTLLCVSDNNSTLACGKILNGTGYDYASMAWTYIDESEDGGDGLDFSPSGTQNGYDYVDLGIGVGWAVQNVGASSPEKSGGYYMWGETVTRSSSWWWYYSLYKGNVNDFLEDDKFYTPYSDISGTSYDAARVKMGGKWRMPTRAEYYTLFNNCSFEYGEYNGVAGYIVTGPSGKSIFLPATGLKKKDEIRYANTVYLWSSTTYGKSNAYFLEGMKSYKNSGVHFQGKYYGMPVRGVINLE